jgi:hypothetical protein
MQTARAHSAVVWPDLAASAVWWAYDRAPAGLDAMLHVGRRYLAPLLQPRMPVRRLGLASDVAGSLLTAFGQSMTLDRIVHGLRPIATWSAELPSASLADTIGRLRSGAFPGDASLASLPRFAAGLVGDGCLRIPALVSLELPLAGGVEDSLGRATTTVRRDARRVLDAGTTWSVSHELSEFEQFYQEFYTPSVSHRFGELAVLRERAMLRRQFRQGGGLIWLEIQGRRIAGTVVQLRGTTLHGLVAAADPSVRCEGRAGPQFAVKIAAIDVAAKLGATKLDLGGTVPFLCDGNLQAKRAFGGTIRRPDDSHRDLVLSWRVGVPAVRHLLHQAPLVFEFRHELHAVAAAALGTLADAREGSRLWRQYAPGGLRRRFVLGAAGWSSHAGDGSPAPSGPIVLCPDVDAAALNRAAAALD